LQEERKTEIKRGKAMDDIKQVHQAIIFIYNADRQKYVKLFKQMENYMLQK